MLPAMMLNLKAGMNESLPLYLEPLPPHAPLPPVPSRAPQDNSIYLLVTNVKLKYRTRQGSLPIGQESGGGLEVDAGINLKATIVQSFKYNLLMESEHCRDVRKTPLPPLLPPPRCF
jgi:hypothetical protein